MQNSEVVILLFLAKRRLGSHLSCTSCPISYVVLHSHPVTYDFMLCYLYGIRTHLVLCRCCFSSGFAMHPCHNYILALGMASNCIPFLYHLAVGLGGSAWSVREMLRPEGSCRLVACYSMYTE